MSAPPPRTSKHRSPSRRRCASSVRLASSNKASALAREPILLHKSSLLLGELLLQLGRTHDALTAYREALDFAIDQNGHGSAWIGIASALRIMDRHEEALEALEHAESALGESADLRNARAHSHAARQSVLPARPARCVHAGARAGAPLRAAGAVARRNRARAERPRRCVLSARQDGDRARALRPVHRGSARSRPGRRAAVEPADARDHAHVLRRPGREPRELPRRARAGAARRRPARRAARAPDAWRAACSCRRSSTTAASTRAQAMQLAKQLGARRFEAECVGIVAATMIAEDPAQALQLVEGSAGSSDARPACRTADRCCSAWSRA